jgi:hypothetical protein
MPNPEDGDTARDMPSEKFPDLFGPNKASDFVSLVSELRWDRPGFAYHPQGDEGYSPEFLVTRAATIINQLQGNLNEVGTRVEALERAQVEFIAMLCRTKGEIRLMPVLLRGDEEVLSWDDPATGERVYRLRIVGVAAGIKNP